MCNASRVCGKGLIEVIVAYVRCSDGPEGDWTFETLPRVGEEVMARLSPPVRYVVRRVEHWPTGDLFPSCELGVSLYLDPIGPATPGKIS